MLKIRVKPTEKYMSRFFGFFEVASLLRDLGIEFGLDVKRPDMLFCHISALERNTDPGVYSPIPLIVYERNDSASIYPTTRRPLLKRPDVVGWAKGMGLRHREDYNAPVVEGKRHLAFVAPDEAEVPEPILDESDLAKMYNIMPVLAWEIFRPLLNGPAPQLRRRLVDIAYTGAMSNPDSHVGNHRITCTRAMANLTGRNVLVGMGRCFALDAMYELMRSTKVFVSPYGQGEYSSKDYEAILCGCLLLKADSTHVHTYGFDIFSQPNSSACKADFTDLAAVTEQLLYDWKGTEQRAEAARERLISEIGNHEKRAADFAAFFSACAERIDAAR